MKRVAIFGATGYTGFELIRLLLSHPGVQLSVLTSEQYSSQPVEQAFPPFKGMLAGVSFGKMERLLSADFDVAFLALPHTSEFNGYEFDSFGDTPECPDATAIDSVPCADEENFMFPMVRGLRTQNFSHDQILRVLGNPLIRP